MRCAFPWERRRHKKKGALVDATTKGIVFREMLRKRAAGGADITPEDWRRFVAAQNDGYRTGPKVGEKVPGFSLSDQYGKSRTLGELMGPDGLLLVFSRSAHW